MPGLSRANGRNVLRSAGVSPAKHQLLLAIRGHPDPRGPTIGDVADYLLLRHHSAVELVDRAEVAELVRRRQDRDDHRIVRLRLTPRGAETLRRLTAVTLEELARLSPRLRPVWAGLETARTMAVNSLVMGEIFYLFNSRFIHAPATSGTGLFGNRYALAAVAVLLVLQAAFTYAPAMQRLFGTEGLELVQWGFVIAFGLAVFVLVEIEKWTLRRLGLSGAIPEAQPATAARA